MNECSGYERKSSQWFSWSLLLPASTPTVISQIIWASQTNKITPKAAHIPPFIRSYVTLSCFLLRFHFLSSDCYIRLWSHERVSFHHVQSPLSVLCDLKILSIISDTAFAIRGFSIVNVTYLYKRVRKYQDLWQSSL